MCCWRRSFFFSYIRNIIVFFSLFLWKFFQMKNVSFSENFLCSFPGNFGLNFHANLFWKRLIKFNQFSLSFSNYNFTVIWLINFCGKLIFIENLCKFCTILCFILLCGSVFKWWIFKMISWEIIDEKRYEKIEKIRVYSRKSRMSHC
jgi:hypothetical protein